MDVEAPKIYPNYGLVGCQFDGSWIGASADNELLLYSRQCIAQVTVEGLKMQAQISCIARHQRSILLGDKEGCIYILEWAGAGEKRGTDGLLNEREEIDGKTDFRLLMMKKVFSEPINDIFMFPELMIILRTGDSLLRLSWDLQFGAVFTFRRFGGLNRMIAEPVGSEDPSAGPKHPKHFVLIKKNPGLLSYCRLRHRGLRKLFVVDRILDCMKVASQLKYSLVGRYFKEKMPLVEWEFKESRDADAVPEKNEE